MNYEDTDSLQQPINQEEEISNFGLQDNLNEIPDISND